MLTTAQRDLQSPILSPSTHRTYEPTPVHRLLSVTREFQPTLYVLECSLAIRSVGVGVGESSKRFLVHGAQYVGLDRGEARPLASERSVEVLRVHRMSL